MNKIAFLFSGQGSQYVGMGKFLYDSSNAAKEIFHIANKISGKQLSDICFYGPEGELKKTVNTQPALLATELAGYNIALEHDIRPDYVAGFSLGEWAALAAAEVIGATEALEIVKVRAELMQNAIPIGSGGMVVAIGVDQAKVEDLCSKVGYGVWPSNYNCDGQITIAGTTEGITIFTSLAQQEDIMLLPVSMSVPSHCPLMKVAAEGLLEELKMKNFSEAKIPIVMNVNGQFCNSPEEIKNNMIQQLISPVLFSTSLRTLANAGVNIFIEIGAGKTLSGFVKRTIPTATILRIEDEKSLSNTIQVIEKMRENK